MRNVFLSVLALALLPGFVFTQNKEIRNFGRSAVINLSEVQEDFHVKLQNLEAPFPGNGSYRGYLAKMKKEIMENFEPAAVQQAHKTSGSAPQPTIGINFRGNTYFDGVPNDNNMAISKDYKIISAINSNFFVFDSSGTNLLDISLGSFAAPLGVTGSKYDPKVVYDPDADRFILTFLNGFTDSTSMIIMAFSQTNDPAGNWNLYALPGDPRSNGTWTDYPAIAITQDELFLTTNSLLNGVSWQLGFVETLIWQIDKSKGYNGDSLASQIWSDILFDGAPIRNLCPIQGGEGPTGPNMYLLSNRNFAVDNDTIFFLEITDTLGAAGASLNINYLLSDQDYGMPPFASQAFNQFLATNDARVLGGFLHDNTLQFVGNTIDFASGHPAVYHGIISDVSGNPSLSGFIYGDSLVEYGYPNIALLGSGTGNQEAVIAVNYTTISADSFPGCGAIYYDGAGNYSDPLAAKIGERYINVINGVDRWGDYSTAQRDYANPGKVWICAGYARGNRTHGTWIAEYGAPNTVDRSSVRPAEASVNAWPNPVTEYVSLEFRLDQSEWLDISLYNLKGKKVRVFLQDLAKSGLNRFSFYTDDLPEGLYLLRVEGKEGTVASKKIIVAR